MGRLLLTIEVIPHKDERYSTAGDWQIDADGVIRVRVSDTGRDLDALLIGIHESVEAILCREHFVEEKDIDEFDMAFEAARKPGNLDEPGEDPKAPYRREHATADVVERLVALASGTVWKNYSARVDALFEEKKGGGEVLVAGADVR